MNQECCNGPVTLPAAPEDFIECQEQLICRKLSPAEKEVTAEWLAIFNDIRTGDMDGTVVVERIGYLIDRTEKPGLLRFLLAAREWIIYAWKGAQ